MSKIKSVSLQIKEKRKTLDKKEVFAFSLKLLSYSILIVGLFFLFFGLFLKLGSIENLFYEQNFQKFLLPSDSLYRINAEFGGIEHWLDSIIWIIIEVGLLLILFGALFTKKDNLPLSFSVSLIVSLILMFLFCLTFLISILYVSQRFLIDSNVLSQAKNSLIVFGVFALCLDLFLVIFVKFYIDERSTKD